MPEPSRPILARLEIPLILLVAAAAMMLARPYGNFPINDDAHYAIASWDFARTGHFHLTLETVPSLRAQVVWGALFTRLFGESFEVLRASTMTLAALTLLLINRLLAFLPIPRSLRIIATLAFLFHPIFFLSACTFMTEVPFVFASVAAMYFNFRGIRQECIAFIALGGAAAAVSWWVRQTGVINVLPPLLALIVFRNRISERWRRLIVAAAAPLVLFAAIFLTRPEWLMGSQQEFRLHYKMWSESTFRLPQQVSLIFHYCFFNMQNNALFLLPLTIAVDWRLFRSAAARVVAVVSALVFLAGMTQLIVLGHPMPYFTLDRCCDVGTGNAFVNFGIGPLTLIDRDAYPFAMPYSARLILSYGVAALAAAMVAGIFIRSIDAVREPKSSALPILGTIHAVIGTFALCASEQYYDRYALDATWSLVLVIPLIVRWDVRAARVLSIAMLLIIAAFSIFATGEYFAWNRARWEAWSYFRARGGQTKDLDAGAEPFTYYELARITDYRERRRVFSGPQKRPYMIAFNRTPGFRVIRTFPFSGWAGLHRADLYLLEKIDRAP